MVDPEPAIRNSAGRTRHGDRCSSIPQLPQEASPFALELLHRLHRRRHLGDAADEGRADRLVTERRARRALPTPVGELVWGRTAKRDAWPRARSPCVSVHCGGRIVSCDHVDFGDLPVETGYLKGRWLGKVNPGPIPRRCLCVEHLVDICGHDDGLLGYSMSRPVSTYSNRSHSAASRRRYSWNSSAVSPAFGIQASAISRR